jgi:hypothetical protein
MGKIFLLIFAGLLQGIVKVLQAVGAAGIEP